MDVIDDTCEIVAMWICLGVLGVVMIVDMIYQIWKGGKR